MLVPNVVVVSYYFEKKRRMANAIAASGVGFGTFVIPPFVRLLVQNYQWRGSLLILGGVTLNMIVAAAIFRPVILPHFAESGKGGNLLDFKMLRQLPFMCLFLNNVLALYGIVAYFVHLPPYAKYVGFDDDESAIFVSISGAANVAVRLLCAVLLQKLNAPISVYALSLGFGGLCIMTIPFVKSSAGLSSLCALIGMGYGPCGALLAPIIADLVGIQALSDGYGYIMVADGIGSLLGPPIAGERYLGTVCMYRVAHLSIPGFSWL